MFHSNSQLVQVLTDRTPPIFSPPPLSPPHITQFRPQQDAVSYFRKTVATHKTLLTYETLASAGILPSLTQTYTLEQVQGALEKQHGGGVNVNCDGSVFEEVW
jgi:ribonuclease T2